MSEFLSLTLRFFNPQTLRLIDPLIAQLFVAIFIKDNSPVAIKFYNTGCQFRIF